MAAFCRGSSRVRHLTGIKRGNISLHNLVRRGSSLPAYEQPLEATDSLVEEHIFNQQHVELRQAYRKLIDKEINPNVERWEKEEAFPAHELFKKLGDAGFLGVNKPEEYGGLGLDYSYAIAVAEEAG